MMFNQNNHNLVCVKDCGDTVRPFQGLRNKVRMEAQTELLNELIDRAGFALLEASENPELNAVVIEELKSIICSATFMMTTLRFHLTEKDGLCHDEMKDVIDRSEVMTGIMTGIFH